MSLKGFHLVFVTLLTALAFLCATWAFTAGHAIFGVAGVASGVLVIVYGVYFLNKLKNVDFL